MSGQRNGSPRYWRARSQSVSPSRTVWLCVVVSCAACAATSVGPAASAATPSQDQRNERCIRDLPEGTDFLTVQGQPEQKQRQSWQEPVLVTQVLEFEWITCSSGDRASAARRPASPRRARAGGKSQLAPAGAVRTPAEPGPRRSERQVVVLGVQRLGEVFERLILALGRRRGGGHLVGRSEGLRPLAAAAQQDDFA